MSPGKGHLPRSDGDTEAISFRALCLEVSDLRTLGGYGIEGIAVPRVRHLPAIGTVELLKQCLRMVLYKPSPDGIVLPSLTTRAPLRRRRLRHTIDDVLGPELLKATRQWFR
jgi:hypothetical protein